MSKQNSPLLHRWLESVWYNNGRGKALLLPLSALFCFLAKRRRLKQQQQRPDFTIPIIVVGNISIGGTGKTPLVLALVEQLKQQGFKPGIITRGYKGKSTHWPLSVDQNTPVELSGDEAKLMALRSQVPVIAGASRIDDIRYMLEHTSCNIIISDDGLQHYKMKRDCEIAVIDGERRFGNGHCLPAGPLRELPERLQECNLVMVNGTPEQTEENEYTMGINSHSLISLDNSQHVDDTHFSDIQIYTGIGNPQRFVNHLKEKGINISEAHYFPDHHHFSHEDFNSDSTLPILMTEKDAVKCQQLGLENAWYLPIHAELDEKFLSAFKKITDRLMSVE